MKVKILSISHLYPMPYDQFKGLVVHQQMKGLSERGVEVKVAAPVAWAPFPISHMRRKWKAYSEVPEYVVQDGIEVFRPRYLEFPRALFLASSGYRLYYGLKGLTRAIYKVFPFDIIHAHTALPDGYAAMLLSKIYEKPLVATFRAKDLDITIHRNRGCFNAVHEVLKNSAKVIAPSPRLRDTLLQQMGINSEVVSSGIHKEQIFTGNTGLNKEYEGRSILLSVSQLIRTKGIDLNLKAIAELRQKYPSISYLIIGQGNERARLERLAEDLNLQGNVQFLGQLPHQKVMEYMSMCDIFSLPSWQETLGLVYLEAMAHGKPVIGCQGQGVDGIVVEGETGFLARPGDVDSLVEAISFLLDNPLKAKAIGEQARELVLANYTWEKNAERTMRLYHEVLEH
ncbi:glycosyltransferase, partial [bacterium]|nr:glycosyltransferase [bacterium]